MPDSSKSAFGARADIQAAKDQGLIDPYDILYLDNQEIGWLDRDGNTVISTVRTQDDIQVNGVTGLGIKDGESIPAGKSIDEIIKMLVQKAVPATYTKPTLTLTAPKAGNYEVGTIVSDTLTATFTANDSKGLSQMSLLDYENDLLATPSAQTVVSQDIEVKIVSGTRSYSAEAKYQGATVKQDNLGNDSVDNIFEAGTLIQKKNYVGYWNAFYGCGEGSISATSANVRNLGGKKLNPKAGESFSISLGVGDQWVMFAYPSSLRDVNQVMYVETNDTNCAGNFTKYVIDVQGANGVTGTGYKVYIYEMATPAEATMTFKVTI